MGVHDNADSKYSLMGSGAGPSSGFSKLVAKRPGSGDDGTGAADNGASLSKIHKFEEPKKTSTSNGKSSEIVPDKVGISLQQQRKALPVFRLKKEYV